MPSSDALLACPRCGGELPALRCASCGVQYAAPGGIPDLRLPSGSRTERVRQFYAQAPFPGYPPRDSLSALRARAGRSDFARALDAAIPGDASVLEMGCGTGQLSLFLATADRTVVGADLTRASLELAQAAAARFGVRGVRFVETDLRAPGLRREAFDVVICSGVLHHTPDPRASFAALSPLVRPGGVVVLGLYNVFARLPLRARRVVARLSRFRWIPGDPVLRDRRSEPARREAWLRDQYRHVEEHRHTLGEVRGWLRENGFTWLRAFPSTLLDGGSRLLFEQEDDWAVERAVAQLGWMRSLGHEGGLFVAVGARTA
ncbi:MAG TPA: class I SAM-dependent methyltransferase [Myxococcales bacterium]|nr:class I SAM-dependent methyltransferase [Myxococcales bacterium]